MRGFGNTPSRFLNPVLHVALTVVLNRKNSLFVGNPRGGRTAAILASLTSSCRRHEMDPQLYFIQLLMNLPSWPASDLDAWLPDRWKQAHDARCEALGIPPLDS